MLNWIYRNTKMKIIMAYKKGGHDRPYIDKLLSEVSDERLSHGILLMMALDRDDEMLSRQIELYVDTQIYDYPDEIVTMDDVFLLTTVENQLFSRKNPS